MGDHELAGFDLVLEQKLSVLQEFNIQGGTHCWIDWARPYLCRDLLSYNFEVVSSHHSQGRLTDVIGLFKFVMPDNSRLSVPFRDGLLSPGNFDCAVSTMVLERLRGLDALSTRCCLVWS